MIIYIDNDYKCHITKTDELRTIETDFFDGKCKTFIEGYRYVPEGEEWTRADGMTFYGEMITPWKNFIDLLIAQQEYENEQLKAALADADSALAVLGVTV